MEVHTLMSSKSQNRLRQRANTYESKDLTPLLVDLEATQAVDLAVDLVGDLVGDLVLLIRKLGFYYIVSETASKV